MSVPFFQIWKKLYSLYIILIKQVTSFYFESLLLLKYMVIYWVVPFISKLEMSAVVLSMYRPDITIITSGLPRGSNLGSPLFNSNVNIFRCCLYVADKEICFCVKTFHLALVWKWFRPYNKNDHSITFIRNKITFNTISTFWIK